MSRPSSQPSIVIACGGTGGHLFPGIAVGHAMLKRGWRVCLVVSEKEVDRHAVSGIEGMEVLTVPAVGWNRGKAFAFARGFAASTIKCVSRFRKDRPQIALSMGGFTSAPPLLAAKSLGIPTFLHESNSIAGKANRTLSRLVRESFIGFPSAAARLKSRKVTMTGTPVRPDFFAPNKEKSCAALCLDPAQPVVLVMGGSQGAEGINRLVVSSIPQIAAALPGCQWLHVAGSGKAQSIKAAYASAGVRAEVYGFMSRMDVALGAASVAVSRSGASSLAELAATEVPSILIPFPTAADNHQFFNAKAYTDTGAAVLLEQKDATPESLISLIRGIVLDVETSQKMRTSLRKWQSPQAADAIADAMLSACRLSASSGAAQSKGASSARMDERDSGSARREKLSGAGIGAERLEVEA